MDATTIKNIILNNFDRYYINYIFILQVFILFYIPYLYICILGVNLSNTLYKKVNAEYECNIKLSSKNNTNE